MKRVFLLCSLLWVSAAGSGHAWGAQMHHAKAGAMCPAGVPGTTISTEDIRRGIAVTFVTSEEARVAELRRRVLAMARMHESRVTGGRPRRMRMHVIPGSATVEEVRDGARIVFEPKDAANLDDLRTHVRVMVTRMEEWRRTGAEDAGECPMMELMKEPEAPPEEEGRPR